jgi:pimeloyl-ACP methyl ester carboxylesterase
VNAAADSSRGFATNVEANREYADFDVVLMEGVGHYLQLERPEEFNEKMRAMLVELTAPPAK